MLLGEDRCAEAIWRKLYSRSKMNGARRADCAMGRNRHGALGYHGQALGLPIYKLLGGASKQITPYASLMPLRYAG